MSPSQVVQTGSARRPTKQQPLHPLVSKIEEEQKVSDAALLADAKAQILALESQLQDVRLDKQQSLEAGKAEAERKPVNCTNFR